MAEKGLNENFIFYGVPQAKQKRIFNILCACKEIRDTKYPLTQSGTTKLEISSLTAHKEKDLYYISGELNLNDCNLNETRDFEAYILDYKNSAHVYLDVRRKAKCEGPKIIRTSEEIVLNNKNIMDIIKYNGMNSKDSTSCDEIPLFETNIHEPEQLSTF
jgi:hypothetical protein